MLKPPEFWRETKTWIHYRHCRTFEVKATGNEVSGGSVGIKKGVGHEQSVGKTRLGQKLGHASDAKENLHHVADGELGHLAAEPVLGRVLDVNVDVHLAGDAVVRRAAKGANRNGAA